MSLFSPSPDSTWKNIFEVRIEKSKPRWRIPLRNLASNEGNLAVYDGKFLWRIDVDMDAEDFLAGEADSFQERFSKALPDHQFPYHEHGLPPIVFAQITGASVASL